MNYKIKFFALLLVAALSCLPTYADMIQNGSFESASVNPGSGFSTLYGGSTSITGWTVLGGSIDYIGGYWKASDGERSLDLNGNAQGGVEQSINTVIGNTYMVSYDLASNTDGSPTIKYLNVNAAGISTQTVSFSFDKTGHTRSNMGWVTESWTFVADDTITKLQFISGITGAYGPALDNVKVEDMSIVPLPGAFLLGLIGMGIAGIKTRKSI